MTVQISEFVDSTTVGLTRVECGCCGGVYAIVSRYHDHCRDNNKSWRCPYCVCTWGFDHDGSPLSKAKREAARLRDRLVQTKADLRETEARRRGEKAAKTRLRNRIVVGVCPCCNRTFQNLHRHMDKMHPEFKEQE